MAKVSTPAVRPIGSLGMVYIVCAQHGTAINIAKIIQWMEVPPVEVDGKLK